nr:reverse transcriptase domain-containing protein [Tanacetum cinerariifolium]
AEFAYNKSVNRTTGKSPFEVVYGWNLITPPDLVPVLEINDNTYKIELYGYYNVSATFNILDLSPYKGDSDDELDSGSSFFQEWKDDTYAVNDRINVTNTLSIMEPAPPAPDPFDVETIERVQQWIQELELQQLRYVNRLYQPRRNDHAVDCDDRYRDDPICSLGLKIEIHEFTGKVHPDDFIDWLSRVEWVFDVRDIPNNLKVKLVAIKLRQHASLWWDHVNKMRHIEGKTWENLAFLSIIS